MPFYEHNETKMYYETEGEGIPFLIIHGWAIDHRFTRNMMEPVFEALRFPTPESPFVDEANEVAESPAATKTFETAKEFKRIYIDVPGMGLSLPGKITTGDGILEVIDSFMNDTFPNEKFCIGGNSFGAGISRAYTAKHPEKILALLLIVPSTGKLGKVPVNSVAEKDETFLATLSPKEKAAFSCMNAILTEESWKKFKNDVYPSVLINEDNEYLHGILHGTFSFDIDSAQRKHPFRGPVYIICGSHDTAVGYEDQKKWLDLYPNSLYKLIEKAGHNIFVDRPEEFTLAVAEWINSLNF